MNWLRHFFLLDTDRTGRIFGLDVLRSLGIVLVIEAHAYHLIVHFFPDKFLFVPLLDKVAFSFVLSGYLIGGSLIKLYERSDFAFAHIRTFWIRRWLRTIPAYLLVITALVALRYTFTTVGFSFPWRHYFFLQNLWTAEADPYYFYPEGWSLSVEEWFYFLVPGLLLIAHFFFGELLPRRWLFLALILSLITLSTTLRVARALHTPEMSVYDWNIHFRKIVLLRLDTLMYGVLAAFVQYYYRGFWERHVRNSFVVFAIGILATLLAYPLFLQHNFWLKTFYITQVAIIVCCLVPLLTTLKTGRGFWGYCCTWLSQVSFCIYLLNRTPILKSMMQLFPTKDPLWCAVEYVAYILILIVAATLMHRYIERPILRLREHLK